MYRNYVLETKNSRAIVPENSSEVLVDVSFISSFEGLFECPFLTPLIDLDVVELLVWDKSKVENVHFIYSFWTVSSPYENERNILT